MHSFSNICTRSMEDRAVLTSKLSKKCREERMTPVAKNAAVKSKHPQQETAFSDDDSEKVCQTFHLIPPCCKAVPLGTQ